MSLKALKEVPEVWRSLAIIALAISVGWTAQRFVGVQFELPQRVKAQNDSIAAHSQHLNRLDTAVIGLRRDMGDTNATLRRMLCMQIAERQKTPWQDCFK